MSSDSNTTSQNDPNKYYIPKTPDIIQAAKDGNTEEIKRILAAELYVDAIDTYYMTALHWAAEKGHSKCVELLLAGGVSVNEADDFKDTPLHLAEDNNNNDCVKLLIASTSP